MLIDRYLFNICLLWLNLYFIKWGLVLLECWYKVQTSALENDSLMNNNVWISILENDSIVSSNKKYFKNCNICSKIIFLITLFVLYILLMNPLHPKVQFSVIQFQINLLINPLFWFRPTFIPAVSSNDLLNKSILKWAQKIQTTYKFL